MRLTQEFLHDQEILRIRRSRPELLPRLESAGAAGLIAARTELADSGDTGVLVVSVVRRFDLTSWIQGTCVFVAGLPSAQARAWRRSFTKTAFLAGNPYNLAGRFDFEHVNEDRTAAWTAPSQASELATLRRLLKLFESRHGLPSLPELSIAIPEGTGPGLRPQRRRSLYVSTAGVSLSEGMVNLNHLLAEAVIDGLLTPGDLLTVRHVPRLGGVPEPLEAVRVGPDPADPDRLRAFAALTKETIVD